MKDENQKIPPLFNVYGFGSIAYVTGTDLFAAILESRMTYYNTISDRAFAPVKRAEAALDDALKIYETTSGKPYTAVKPQTPLKTTADDVIGKLGYHIWTSGGAWGTQSVSLRFPNGEEKIVGSSSEFCKNSATIDDLREKALEMAVIDATKLLNSYRKKLKAMKILQLIISILVFIAVATLVLVHIPRIHGFGWGGCIALLGTLAWLVKASYAELTEKD